MMKDVNDVINKIKEFYNKYNKVPTTALFCKEYGTNAAYLYRSFGSWNVLLQQCNLKINKSTKRSLEELFDWLKSHPDTTYLDMPTGIRSALEKKFGSITKARQAAGIKNSDKRFKNSKKQRHDRPGRPIKYTGGRPIEFTKEFIIAGLIELATKLKRPPRLIDIKKKTCGFTPNIVLLRFGSINNALQQASLPPIKSFHEYNKLCYELELFLVNIKMQTLNLPAYYKQTLNKNEPAFVYDDRVEYVKLSRTDIQKASSTFEQNHNDGKKVIVYYLIDDSLYENDNITMINVNTFLTTDIGDELVERLKTIISKYDDLNRKYIWERAQLVKDKL